ncbi:VWA domain-containing protein [Dactylosporangium sp. NPDC005572]|uniref:VWA domain-containing protein n=1 Tax=Dactylosporangium sp. NPDC005572 TaxID=3156889 RepID=UPI0033B6F754
MSLHWPWALTALLAFPLLLAFRWWTRRRRRRETVRLASVALVAAALPGRTSWKRRIPLALFAVGLVVVGTAAARPQASVIVPDDAATILLAVDVSGSMCSTDVDPNRLSAAQDAARKFIRDHDGGAKIGLVTFSGIAGLLVPPTRDQDQLLKAIDGLRTSRGTAIGLAILASIDAIAEINPDVPPTGVEVPNTTGGPSGDYEPDTIVVLTDGRNTDGVSPITAAEAAAARRLRVYTIGFGTEVPSPMVCTADQISGDTFRGPGGGGGFGGFGGRGRFQEMDEATLTKVADMTGGKYFKAENAEALTEVLQDLPSQVTLQRKNTEITSWFVLVGALLITAAVALSQWWNRSRLPGAPALALAARAGSPPRAPAAPGSSPGGSSPPGSVPPGSVPPGSAPRGPVLPGSSPLGSAPRGSVLPGSAPSGSATRGLLPPGSRSSSAAASAGSSAGSSRPGFGSAGPARRGSGPIGGPPTPGLGRTRDAGPPGPQYTVPTFTTAQRADAPPPLEIDLGVLPSDEPDERRRG